MIRAFKNRRNRNPVQKAENEKDNTPFFTKENRTPFFNNPIQAKLKIGKPDDKFEKEADKKADAVVDKTSNSDDKDKDKDKEFNTIQKASLSTPQEDEKLGTAEQRMEEDKMVQEKLEIQRMENENMEEEMLNKMETEEEEAALQTKKTAQGTTHANPSLTQKLKSKKGLGKPIPKNTLEEMETSFKKDFSGVNIHTDRDAADMNKALGAQAFTHGKDIYFSPGKYKPESSTGKHLLAHELTHVIQQSKDIQPKIQAYPVPASLSCDEVVPWLDANSPYLPGWAQTNSDYSFIGNLNISAPETTEEGLVRLVVSGHKRLRVTVSTTIDKPSWRPARRPNRATEVAAWNSMMSVLSAHEQEHRTIGERWRITLEERFRAIHFSVEAENREAAITMIQERLAVMQSGWTAEAQAAQDAIDPFNSATLSCPSPEPAP